MNRQKKLAILCAGGPAPGLNSVIAAATIRAQLSGVDVLGIHDGFRWLMEGDISRVSPLTISSVSRIHFRGGSHIGISRANPTRDEAALDAVLLSLLRLDVDKLITIGGDGTAWSAHCLERRAKGQLRVAHVPKTIDNDLDLPSEVDTFGFQTARHVGVEIVKNLMVDAKTTHRWYYVVTMGRKAGHLALGIGKASGATVTLIPEEFRGARVPMQRIVDILVGAAVKRLANGRSDGVAILAEGLLECLGDAEIASLEGPEGRDQHGGLRFAEVNLAEELKGRVIFELRKYGLKGGIVAKSIGYELRCVDPIPYDMDYTRDLGYCAARFLIEGGGGSMVSMQGGRFRPMPFSSIMDLSNGRTRVRMVDTDSDRYRIALSYMVRLKRDDFDDAHELAKLAATVHLSPDAFRERYEYVTETEPQPKPSLSRMPPPPAFDEDPPPREPT
ncbi:MAG: diphosphate--fructose-6-phosphate 1-phosphotransferase [Polyangiales bacterium]